MMKSLIKLGAFILAVFLFTSCATIIGGSNYYAHVKVKDNPNAQIVYKGVVQGAGDAVIKVKRSEADKFSLTFQQEGCEDQKINFFQRSFRGWALFGTIITWTGVYAGIPLPWGIIVDSATGALWKPNINEKGVTKTNYKHYNYLIEYDNCKK